MPSVDTNQLRAIIETQFPVGAMQMLFKDSFAVGCFLHLQGHKRTGRKMCSEVLSALGYERRKTYFISLLDNLAGSEIEYAMGVWAHSEVNDLFEAHPGYRAFMERSSADSQ